MTRPVSACALLAMALGIACTPSPPEESQEPPAPEPLWVGILRRDGALIPIARYDRSHSVTTDPGAELRDEPWPELFELEYLRFDRRTGAARVMEPRWVRGTGADSRLVWEESEQADWRPTMAAPVRWHLYADGESVATLDAEHLNVRGMHCMAGWALGAAANGRAYEGEGYQVVEIQGDQGRLVADVHGGGC
ncbi:hypothetical protein [Candidatus Palauibacter sp.]|uniref:hypothetical protein n=1 Tax=Candidatus Palauibacter sp. TaxID=3101350 RepID=UPI003B5CAC6E